MKIGYLMQSGVPDMRGENPSGPANHVIEVIKGLQQQGHHVRLLANLGGTLYCSDDLAHYTPATDTILDRFPLKWFERVIRRIQSELNIPYAEFFESLRFALACRKKLKGVDLLYERMGWFGYGGAIASRWLGLPLFLEVNGDHLAELEMLGCESRGIQRWLSTALVSRMVENSTHIVATGDGWRSRFIERWDVPPDRISVVENGSRYVEILSRDQLASFSGDDPSTDDIEVIYCGGFEPWHGIPILVQAFQRCIQQGMRGHLKLIGGGSLMEKVRSLVQELGLEECITLMAPMDQVKLANHLAAADVGVSPYYGRVEYSGLKLIDFKAAGLAIIASGEHGQPAVIEHGRTGWIVPPGDIEALSLALQKFASDPRIRKLLGRQARLEAEQQHSWAHCVQKLEQTFKDFISSDRKAIDSNVD